jgi:hypothetical protein
VLPWVFELMDDYPSTAPPPRLHDYQGLTLKDRYVIEREIGRGGIGIVYLARDKQLLSKPVVIKVLLDAAGSTDWVKKKFRQEIEALARIDHPGVVGALDAGEMPDGKPYLVMQFVEGVTLRSILDTERMALERVGLVVRKIGQALNAAHDKGVYHRDLKPDNIMIQTVGEGEEYVKLIDFGIATVKNADQLDANTAFTTVAGTVNYMAPEQLEGRPSASSDIYALGIMAYEMVAGRRPFNPASPYQLLELQRRGVRVNPSALCPDLPPAAEAAILRALAFDPKDRYQRARDFGDDLARALAASAEPQGPYTAPVASGETRMGAGRETAPATRAPGTIGAEAKAGAPRDSSGTHASTMLYGEPTIQDTVPIRAQPELSAPPEADRASAEPRPTRAPFYMLLAMAIPALLAFGTLAWYAWNVDPNDAWYPGKPAPAPAPGPGPTPPPAPEPERALSYSITVQKYRAGKPYQEPFQLSSEINFEKDYRVRLNLASPQAGHLYILNEGPPAADGAASFNLLFPSPTANGGESLVTASTPVQVPAQSWFAFDDMAGTEKLWLVWSKDSVPELEAVKGVANAKDRGAITVPEQLGAVRAFLARSAASTPELERNAETKETVVRGRGDALVHLLRLEHH